MERVLERTSQWALSEDQAAHFSKLKQRSEEEGKPMVLWGWKRDRIELGMRFPESRTVYFSADLKEEKRELGVERAFFFLETRAENDQIAILREQIGNHEHISTWVDSEYPDYSRLRMTVGQPREYDLLAVQRRLKGKPRLSIPPPRLVAPSQDYDLSSLAPFALCVGSGLSAESGLPLLGEIHNLFEVDNRETGELVFGAADNLPARIIADPEGEFAKFCQFSVDAVKAEPSDSHLMLADMYNRGAIRQVLTDNMDHILDKIDVPYTKTRLSIFPDRFPVGFDSQVKSLLVVGVAVDRRDVIKQARHAGLKIVAINPVMEVAPHSRNMDYLRNGDLFFRETAREALPKIISKSGF